MLCIHLINPRSASALLSSLFYDMLLLLLYRGCTKTYHNSCLSVTFCFFCLFHIFRHQKCIKITLFRNVVWLKFFSFTTRKIGITFIVLLQIFNRFFFCFCRKDNLFTLYPNKSKRGLVLLGAVRQQESHQCQSRTL